MKRQMHLWMVVLAVVTLLTGMATGCGATTGSTGSAQALKNHTPGPAPDAAGGGAAQEGIKVHGHWIIEVRNPDGSLAERREFENALSSLGGRDLARLLGRQASIGGWTVAVVGESFGNVWGVDGVIKVGEANDSLIHPSDMARIVEPAAGGTATNDFKTLTVSVPTNGPNLGKLVLSGTATAQGTGPIIAVMTGINTLAASNPPSSSYPTTADLFTQTTLASPVNLTAGQIVQVTVVISFL